MSRPGLPGTVNYKGVKGRYVASAGARVDPATSMVPGGRFAPVFFLWRPRLEADQENTGLRLMGGENAEWAWPCLLARYRLGPAVSKRQPDHVCVVPFSQQRGGWVREASDSYPSQAEAPHVELGNLVP